MVNANNFVNLIGNLGEHPIAKTLPSGTIVTEFSLATNSNYTDREGNKVTKTEWHRVKAFGKAGELLNQYLQRGSQVSILGSIRYSKWTDKYDQPRTSTDIVVESFRFLDGSRQPARTADPSYVGEPDKRTIQRRQATQQIREQIAEQAAQQAALADESSLPDANEDLPF